ncbi:MAG: DUF2309 domain-containing protein [Planctomycetaceae bacterium]|nr:DUF2309 domain-containing protein [Planctomycetaceae bacterium]
MGEVAGSGTVVAITSGYPLALWLVRNERARLAWRQQRPGDIARRRMQMQEAVFKSSQQGRDVTSTVEEAAGVTESARRVELTHLVEHAAHLLPAQGPLEVFVHHNTLHAFEDLTFHEAVKAAQERFGANPYFPESQYRELLDSGRITVADLEAVLNEHLGERDTEQIDGLGTRRQIRLAMLRHPLRVGPDAELRWVVAETNALETFHPEVPVRIREKLLAGAQQWVKETLSGTAEVDDVHSQLINDFRDRFGRQPEQWRDRTWERATLQLLWRICRQGVHDVPITGDSTRLIKHPRDLLLQATGQDINRYAHDLLIRFCGAFLDQGYAHWELPDRDEGLFKAFVSLYSRPRSVPDEWLRGLRDELLSLQRAQTSPEDSIEESLQLLGVADDDRQEFITLTLLSLRGWAGMVWQMETAADWTVRPAAKGSLIEYLAVQLILERQAIAYIGREVFGTNGAVQGVLAAATERLAKPQPLNNERRAFLLFQVGQMLGWQPQTLLNLTRQDWAELVGEVEAFSLTERRRVYHEAYERRYRVAAMDAFANHTRHRHEAIARKARETTSPPSRPSFQLTCCIDDREESFRRHLEEVMPSCETFGAAGFFAVAMKYKGAADGFFKPLCPAVIDPDHYVQEDVGYTFEGVHRTRAQMRNRLGRATYLFHTRSRTFLGGIVAGIVGSLATAPLVARVLFPHLTSRIRSRFGSLLQPPPVTRLQLHRYEREPGSEGGHIGYTLDEMADIVTRLLRDIGVWRKEDFSRLFIICGHGSSSLNNPHESAYCCGACAGKRGGPNARAFAEMANDYRVQILVAERGLVIPDDTFFVGAYHNTCDDSVVYFDLNRLPASHRTEFDEARLAIEEARTRNAHERCRRFASAPLTLTPVQALRHAESRAQDLAQARPEYNHATNALCIVGRRAWTRGLFLDRRAFLTSYDPAQDDEDSSILFRILAAAIPVCAGISLEYYFSCVDYVKYGSGSKLPHNLVSMLGVMEGSASDLRTGLYQQMVEIHEPVRLLFVIETTAEAMLSIMDRHEGIGRLCRGGWVQLAVIDAETSKLQLFRGDHFEPYEPSTDELPEAASSLACYEGSRDHQPFRSIKEART